MTDTFARSCQHWSEDRRAGMDAFYALATVDYRHLAQSRDWAAWLQERAAPIGDRRLQLLDVACGSGKFPSALIAHAGIGTLGMPAIDYALLDPSAFSVAEARQALQPPFIPGTEYICTLQDLECARGAYDVVWATHALYALPRVDLEAGLERFLHAMGPDGTGFIAHASEQAHYLKFYRAYLEGFDRPDSAPYVCAEDITDTLSRMGASFTARDITYENGAPDDQRAAVEGYLQRCLFDDTLTLDDMLSNTVTGPYLSACHGSNAWRFAQRVTMISIQA